MTFLVLYWNIQLVASNETDLLCCVATFDYLGTYDYILHYLIIIAFHHEALGSNPSMKFNFENARKI